MKVLRIRSRRTNHLSVTLPDGLPGDPERFANLFPGGAFCFGSPNSFELHSREESLVLRGGSKYIEGPRVRIGDYPVPHCSKIDCSSGRLGHSCKDILTVHSCQEVLTAFGNVELLPVAALSCCPERERIRAIRADCEQG
jgi:hypothetical protein